MNVIKNPTVVGSSNNREKLQQRLSTNKTSAHMCFVDLTTRGQNTHNYLKIATL